MVHQTKSINSYFKKSIRKLLLALSLFFMICVVSSAQVCDTIKLTSQSAVDSFPIYYSECDSIKIVAISGPDVTALDSLYPLRRLVIDGQLLIDNTSIQSLNGLLNFEEARRITISNNDLFKDTEALKNLRSCGSITFSYNNNLEEAPPLLLDSVHILRFQNNENLKSFDLMRIKYVNHFELYYNPSLNLDELNIDEIASFDSENNKCVSYSGLSNRVINTIGIWRDSLITSIDNLNNIEGLEVVYIQDCEKLETCSSDFICELIDDSSIFTIIHNNAPGCATIEEVKEGCISSLVDASSEQYWITVSPNPVIDELKVAIEDSNRIESFQIYNAAGHLLQEGDWRDENVINVEELYSGLYLMVLKEYGIPKTSLAKFVKL